MKTNNPHIILVGCGRMGSALLQGWIAAMPIASFSVIDPHKPAIDKIDYYESIEAAAPSLKTADAIVLAVKPQSMKEVCETLNPHLSQDTLILSIAAGQSLTRFRSYFGDKRAVIRCMPNTPAAVGKSASVAVSNDCVKHEQAELAATLLQTAGSFHWVEDETLLDAVTAVSGSGPAYVFYMIEALAEAGEKAGLPEDLAMALSRQTVIGSAALAEASEELPAETLRQNVTSPGGTTEAALKVLMNGEFQILMNKAIEAARKRGQELS